MAKEGETERQIGQWQKSWGLLAQCAVWVLGIVGGFLLPPPVGGDSEQREIWERLTQFLVTILLGLLILAGRKWNARRHTRGWVIVSSVSLVAALGTFITYLTLADAWTGNYAGDRVVIGSALTEQGRYYLDLEDNRNISLDTLIEDFTGITEDIWTEESIRRRRLILSIIYLLCLPLLTLSLISTVQALSCRRR